MSSRADTPPVSVYFLWLAIPLLTTCTQACVRLLAAHMRGTPFGAEWFSQLLQTPWLAGVVLCEAAGFAIWLSILSDTSISKAMPISSIAYLMILLMSWTVFGEPFVPLQIVGSALIIAGVWLIAAASSEHPSPPLL